VSETTTEYAIIGAGPAGAHLASRLAEAGREAVLFDPRGAWEKPCGGGLTTRALKEFSFLLEGSKYPCKLIKHITIISPSQLKVTLKVKRPFAVYSRAVLNGLILDRAVEAGVNFIKSAVTNFQRNGDWWSITTADGGTARARFLIGADGAASFTRRRLIGIFSVRDLALAFGYNIQDTRPGQSDAEVTVVFRKDFTGYLWAFPRPGVMNFGVASKLGERTSDELRQTLAEFIRDYYGGEMPESEKMSFFGAKIPTLDLPTWPTLRATGEGWALVGDAAGFADPITGEGIYYALKSADLLANALLGRIGGRRSTAIFPDTKITYQRAAEVYEEAWRRDFGRDLEQASYRLPQFYHRLFFGHLTTDAMVWLARWHRGVRTVLLRALMGEQSYVTLKRDLLLRAFMVA
jgi:geranylgeranyl reductase family protein